MVDLLLAGAAVVLLLIVTVVLLRGERPGRAKLTAAVAVIVVAAGTFAVALYHNRTADKTTSTDLPNPQLAAPPASEGLGAAVHTVEVPMGTGDKLPQGALWLDPPRAGTDAYTGDLSLLCATPSKLETQQSCAGSDHRAWVMEPLGKRALITDDCGGDDFRPGYLDLAEGHTYCLRRTADPTVTYTLRVSHLPTERPLPLKIVVEVSRLPG